MSIALARKTWAMLSASALALVGLTVLSANQQGSSAIAAALKDPLSLLAQRSPGGRAPGALTQTKPVAAALADAPGSAVPVLPSERVLSNVRSRPPIVPGFAAPGADLLGLGDAPVAPGELLPLGGGIPVASGLGFAALPPIIGGGGAGGGSIAPPGGGGGNPSPGDSGVVPPDSGGPSVPPVSGVPEPATWLTMIMGFLAIGGAMRKRLAAGSAATRSAPGVIAVDRHVSIDAGEPIHAARS